MVYIEYSLLTKIGNDCKIAKSKQTNKIGILQGDCTPSIWQQLIWWPWLPFEISSQKKAVHDFHSKTINLGSHYFWCDESHLLGAASNTLRKTTKGNILQFLKKWFQEQLRSLRKRLQLKIRRHDVSQLRDPLMVACRYFSYSVFCILYICS